MGLSWQQGPLGRYPLGSFLIEGGGPVGVSYAQPLQRLMSAELGGQRVVESEDVILLFEPDRYPVAYFPIDSVAEGALEARDRVTDHPGLGPTRWFAVHGGEEVRERGAWEHTEPPGHAEMLRGRVAFAWRAMDAFYEEADRIIGHAADPYHRIDIRASRRTAVVESGDVTIAETTSALVLYECGFAPRWYVPDADVRMGELEPVEFRTFCPYKGICAYWDVGEVQRGAWGYRSPFKEVEPIAGMISFEPESFTITIDGERLLAMPHQHVVSHGVDRNLTVDEMDAIDV